MSRTALPMSAVTVPAFGLGMRPLGPRTRPARPTRDIMSGVATAASKSMLPFRTSLTRSSPPTMSAPASWASRALSPVAKAATRTLRPMPWGSVTVPRTIWSALRGSTPRRKATSTVSSNFAGGNCFNRRMASVGGYCWSRSLLDTSGLLEQLGGRWLFGDEGERAVLVDGQLHRDDLSHLGLGGFVVLAAELHDVHAVLAESCAHRRRGRGLPCPDLELDHGGDFLASASCGCSVRDRSSPPAVPAAPSDLPFGWVRGQAFATWSKASSTGVSRSKMFTRTFSLDCSTLISAMVPWKSANGPATIRTTSPSSHSRRYSGFFWVSSLTARIFSTSRRDRGVGLVPVPLATKPVTPGVLRTTYHESLSYTILTSR